MEEMHQNIQYYAQRWGVVIAKEIKTLSGIVCFGKQGDVPIVLKLPKPNSDEVQQQKITRYFEGRGMIRVLDADNTAILLERLNPGRHLIELTKAGQDAEATHIFCQVVRQLHSARGSLTNFQPINQLALGFDRYIDCADKTISAATVYHAKSLFRALSASQTKPVLLHGDLHHDNILYDNAHGWVAIDPKGYVGEPAYEAGAWIRNPMQYVAQVATCEGIESRVTIMVKEMGWSRERVLEWSYAQAILSAIWAIEDNEKPDAAIEVAMVLRECLRV